MNAKRTMIRGLLHLYPAAWRAEYGEELGALLAQNRITPHAIVDVVLSATRERIRSEIWKVCGFVLLAWSVVGIVVDNTAPLSHETYLWYTRLWGSVVFLTGCLTVLCNRRMSPSAAAVKAAILGFVPEFIGLTLWAAGFIQPLVTKAPGPYPLWESRLLLYDMTFPTTPRPSPAMVPIVTGVVLMSALAMGYAGGWVGRLILSVAARPRVRR